MTASRGERSVGGGGESGISGGGISGGGAPDGDADGALGLGGVLVVRTSLDEIACADLCSAASLVGTGAAGAWRSSAEHVTVLSAVPVPLDALHGGARHLPRVRYAGQ